MLSIVACVRIFAAFSAALRCSSSASKYALLAVLRELPPPPDDLLLPDGIQEGRSCSATGALDVVVVFGAVVVLGAVYVGVVALGLVAVVGVFGLVQYVSPGLDPPRPIIVIILLLSNKNSERVFATSA